MARLWASVLFAFGPLKRAGSVLTWWPPLTAALGLLATAIGVSVPGKVGGHWLAIGGLLIICALLFAAVYRMHKVAYPDFPPHWLSFGNPWYLETEERYEDDLIFLDVTFQSRYSRRMAVEFQMFWEMTWQAEGKDKKVLGPFECRQKSGPLGRLEVVNQPMELEPDGRGSGLLAFGAGPMVGIKYDEHDLVIDPGARLFMRVTDHVSGAEREEETLEVRRLLPTKEKEQQADDR
jgi:hypothetical protein